MVKQLLIAGALVVAMTGTAGAMGDPPGMASIPIREVGSNGRPVTVTTSASFKRNDDLAIVSCLGFRNDGATSATAIKLRFFQLDAFGDVQSSDDKQITGTFAPHVEIGVSLNIWGTPNNVDKRCWTGYLSVPETKRLAVRVEKVLFADGSVWSNPLYGTTGARRVVFEAGASSTDPASDAHSAMMRGN